MACEVFPPFLFLWRLILILHGMFGTFHQWSCLGFGCSKWEVFWFLLRSLSISLFRFYISSWVSLSNLCLSRNLHIFSRLSNLFVYSCTLCFLIILLLNFCKVSIYFTFFIFMTLVIWIFSLFFSLVILANGFKNLVMFSKTNFWFP